jgi:hypothetical protein
MTLAIAFKNATRRLILLVGLLSIFHQAAYSQTDPAPADSTQHGSGTAGALTQVRAFRWVLSDNPSVAASISGERALSHNQTSPAKISISAIAQLTAAVARQNWSLPIALESLATTGSGTPIPTNIIANLSASSAKEATAEPPSPVWPGIAAGPASLPRASSSVQPRLNAFIESRNGRPLLRLKNTDRERSFTGVARITATDGKNEDGVAPVAIELQPNEEKLIAIDKPSLRYGDSIVMVYDNKKVLRIIRSTPFGDRPKPAIAQPEPQLADREFVNLSGILPVGEIEATVNSLGEDDDPEDDSANPAATRKDAITLNITGVFEGEIEGGPAPGTTPAPRNTKPNQ